MLLKNGTILILSPARIERADLRIVDRKVVARSRNLRPAKGEETVDVSGSYIMPGMVNAHTHLYSSLARGMRPPKSPPRNFLEILKRVWWKLDEALDEESIYNSALVGSIEAARCGTTTLIDHHASPNHIAGSLDIIKRAMSVVGMRGILCYETTDRGGQKKRDAGLAENERFVTENTNNDEFRGTIGAHASFTLNDDTLQALGDLAGMYDCGVHIHVAEDKSDVVDAARRASKSFAPEFSWGKPKKKGNVATASMVSGALVRRFDEFGLLTKKSILAHGVHLSLRDLTAINKSFAWIVHNPRSNMNNAVGHAPLNCFGRKAAIGTDGFPADMFEESRIGFFREQESDHRVESDRLPEMLHAGHELVSSFFGQEFGTLKPGSPADLIVLEYAPPTPLTSQNLAGHFLFGMNSRMVRHVMVNGEWRMWNGELVGIDEEKVMSEAAGVARKLWKRIGAN